MPAYSQRQSAAKTQTAALTGLAGLDLTSGPLAVDPRRSPSAPNIMPAEGGGPRKRTGYAVTEQYGGPVYGAYSLTRGAGVIHLVHAGDKLYADGQLIFEGMAKAPSCAVQMARQGGGGYRDAQGRYVEDESGQDSAGAPCLWILDGAVYRCFDGENVRAVSVMATVPTITIAKPPNGIGGVSYLPLNLATGWCIDSFLGAANVKEYYLSFGNLTETYVWVSKMAADGSFGPETDQGFYVDRTLGKITFINAPGASPVTGEDNLRIRYERRTDNPDKVNRCTIATLYGVAGNRDRVFIAGHPDEGNIDRWSEYADPTYFGDVYYGVVGQAGNPIVGYSQVGSRLVTHKRDEEGASNAVVRYGSLGTASAGFADFALFKVENVLQGAGALGMRSIGTVANEPLFLTRQGVFAMTAGDVTGERYMQLRSWYLNGGLLAALRSELDTEGRQTESISCCVWGRFYVLALGGKLWLLDTGQKQYEENSPHSACQYEGYVWEGVDASLVFTRTDPATGEQTLCFGRADGAVCAFKKEGDAGAYYDEPTPGEAVVPVACHWRTPLLHLGSYSRRKTVTGVWVAGSGVPAGGVHLLSYPEADPYAPTMADSGDGQAEVEIFSAGKKARRVKLFAVQVDAGDGPFELEGVQIEYKLGGKVR